MLYIIANGLLNYNMKS